MPGGGKVAIWHPQNVDTGECADRCVLKRKDRHIVEDGREGEKVDARERERERGRENKQRVRRLGAVVREDSASYYRTFKASLSNIVFAL